MPYVIYQFGALTLPAYNGDNDVSAGQVAPAYIDLPGGGVYDVLGAEPAKRRATLLNKICTLDGDSTAALRTSYNALRAKIGRRDRLWRKWDAEYYEWCWARLLNITARRTTRNMLHQEVDLQFMQVSPHWYGQHHGGGWTLDSGVLFDTGYLLDETGWQSIAAGATNITVTNNGNRTVTNAVVTVKAGSANITALTVSVSGISQLQYSGAIVAGKQLVIDCGDLSVTNDGADAYADFAIATNHTIDDWLRLEPGTNTVAIVITGGGTGAQALFEYFDGWE